MKLGTIQVGVSWSYSGNKWKTTPKGKKPDPTLKLRVGLEADFTNSDTQFQIENCASLKEARRVKDLPIDELINSRSYFDWKNSIVTFSFSVLDKDTDLPKPLKYHIVVDQGLIDWESVHTHNTRKWGTDKDLFHIIATSSKVLENH